MDKHYGDNEIEAEVMIFLFLPQEYIRLSVSLTS